MLSKPLLDCQRDISLIVHKGFLKHSAQTSFAFQHSCFHYALSFPSVHINTFKNMLETLESYIFVTDKMKWPHILRTDSQWINYVNVFGTNSIATVYHCRYPANAGFSHPPFGSRTVGPTHWGTQPHPSERINRNNHDLIRSIFQPVP
jgi:hypothetical protein